eukprot:750364_1
MANTKTNLEMVVTPDEDVDLVEELNFHHDRTDDSVMVFNTKETTDTSDNYKLILLVWISRIIPIGAALAAFGYIIYLLVNSDNWSTDPNTEDTEILRREASRGLFVSVVIAILLNLVGAFMFYIRVRESLVVTNYGFILGPVIGFMLDQAIGSDAGFAHFMTTAGVAYTFACLIG